MTSRLRPLALALAGLSACVDASGPERPISGQRLYERHCARCHGPDGKGSRETPSAKDLTNRAYMETLSDDRVEMIILGGRPPAMPGFAGQFADPSLDVLVAYVRSLSDPSVAGATRPPGDG